MDIEGLSEIIASYEYGQHNILEEGTSISYNPRTSQLQLDPFYQFDSSDRSGSCAELAEKAYAEISGMYPSLHVFRTSGHDSAYFTADDAQHAFLLVYDQDLLRGRWHSGAGIDIDYTYACDPLVVDPALGMVKQLSESGYEPKYLMNHGCPICYSNSLTLLDGQQVPIGFTEDNNILSLKANLEREELVELGLHSPEGGVRTYGQISPEIHERIERDRYAQQFLKVLEDCPRELSYKPLRDFDNIMRR